MKLINFLVVLLMSIFIGTALQTGTDAQIIVNSVNIAPYLFIGGLFGLSFIPFAPHNSLAAYAMVSVEKGVNAGRAQPKNYKVIIFRMSDVDTFPDRDANGVRIDNNIILKPGANAIEVEATASTIKIEQKTEGDDDSMGTKPVLSFNVPGTNLALDEFFENNVNEDLGAIVRYCSTSLTPKLFGSPCNPAKMGVESTEDGEGTKNAVTLTQSYNGSRAAHYYGAIPTLDTDSGSGSGV